MGSGWYEREHLAHGFPFLDGKAAIRALRRAGRDRRALVDGGALRPRRRPRTRCATSWRSRGRCSSRIRRSSSAARSKRRFAALAARYATEVQHARRSRRRSCASARRARPRLHGDRARSGDARLLGDDGVLPRRVGRGRAERVGALPRRFAATTPIAELIVASSRDRWLVGTVDEVAERIDEPPRQLGVSRVFLQHLNHDDDEMVALDGRTSRYRAQVASGVMTTTELTGAEDVAWDLSDLYDGRRRSTHRAGRRGRPRRSRGSLP